MMGTSIQNIGSSNITSRASKHTSQILSDGRRASIGTSTSSTVPSTCFGDVQEETKLELTEKLIRFREVSRIALQKSWDEVESLQQRCADHVKINAQLEIAENENQRRKEIWRVRCIALEEVIVQQSSEQKSLFPLRKNMHLNASTNLQEIEETSCLTPRASECLSTEEKHFPFSSMGALPYRRIIKRFLPSTSHPDNTVLTLQRLRIGAPGAATVRETDTSLQLYDNKKKHSQDFLLKISSRNEVIASLEQTLDERLKSIQNVRGEMKCLVDAHRIKEKRQSDVYKQKEERQERLVKRLRKEVNGSDIYNTQGRQNLSDARNYVEELTGRLEHLLIVVRVAEGNGLFP